MAIKILEFPKWIVGGISGFIGAVAGTLTGGTVTNPAPSPSSPEPSPDTAPVEIIPEVIETIAAMSITDILIVLGIGMLAIYGLLAFIRGPRR